MGRLTEEEKRELREEAASLERRRDFEALRQSATGKQLTPHELMDFLNWAQQFSTEDARKRGPMPGDRFLL